MSYRSDITDIQWQFIASFIPDALQGGRPRKINIRTVINAIFYKVDNGCKWRSLPKCFPPWRTVYHQFVEWRRAGVWKKINRTMVKQVRVNAGRKPYPTTVIIDSQSVKTGKTVTIKTRGIDGGKKVKGRKRTIMVDSLGLLVEVKVVKGNTHDTKAGTALVKRVAKRNKLKNSIKLIRVDEGFRGKNFAQIAKDNLNARVEQGSNPGKEAKRFVPTPRWHVERTFAWFYNHRGLLVDHERRLVNARAMVYVVSIRLMLNRLWPLDDRKW